MCKQGLCLRDGRPLGLGSEPSWRQFESDTEKRAVETGREGFEWILMQQKHKLKDWMRNFCALE